METKRRTFDEAFKLEAVVRLLHGDKPITQLAADLGVSPRSLRDWKEHYGPPEPVRRSEALEPDRPIAVLCAAFGVSRSGYHAWKIRPPSARADTDAELGQHLCRAHTDSRQTFGSPHVTLGFGSRVGSEGRTHQPTVPLRPAVHRFGASRFEAFP